MSLPREWRAEVKSVFMGRGGVNVELELKDHEPPWLPKFLLLSWPVGAIPDLLVGEAIIISVNRAPEER
jgi:hypothetical protein